MNGLFGLNGLTGFIIAVVLLLSIVAGLGTCAILTQQSVATSYYKIEHVDSIKQISTDNAEYRKSTNQEVSMKLTLIEKILGTLIVITIITTIIIPFIPNFFLHLV